jgi:hypothetical protein
MLSTLDSWLASVLMDLPEDMKYDPSNAVVQKDNNSPSLRPPFNQGAIAKDELPASQFAKLLHLKLHTLLILLHRPYIADTAGASGQKPQQPRLVVSRPSLDICTYASSIITHICNEMSAKDLSLLAKTCSGLYAMITALRIHLMNALSNESKLIAVGEANFERALRLLKSVWTTLPGEMVSETIYSLEQQYRSKGKQMVGSIKNGPLSQSPMTDSTLSTPNDPQQRMESFSSPRDGSRASGSPIARMTESEESQFQFVQSKRDPATGNPKHTLPLKIIPYGPPGEATSSFKQQQNSNKEKMNGGGGNVGVVNGLTNGISNGAGHSLSPPSSISTQNTPPVSHLGYSLPMSLAPNSSTVATSLPSTPYDVNDHLGYVSNSFFPPLPNGTMAHPGNLIFGHPHMTSYPDNDAHMADIIMNEMDQINNTMTVFNDRHNSGYLLESYLHDDHQMHELSMMNGSSAANHVNTMAVCHDDNLM